MVKRWARTAAASWSALATTNDLLGLTYPSTSNTMSIFSLQLSVEASMAATCMPGITIMGASPSALLFFLIEKT